MLHSRFSPFLILGLGLILTACPSNKEHTQSSPHPESSASSPLSHASKTPSSAPGSVQPSSASSHATQAGVQRGIFVYGDGYQTFKPCGGKEEYWVIDTPDKGLETQYKALKTLELEPVYVEVEGQFQASQNTEGFAAEYSKTLKVQKIRKIRTWIADGSCFQPEFVAQGPHPDWNLQILKGGDVFFKSNEGEFPYVQTLAYSAPEQAGNRWKYAFHYRTPNQETLQAELTEESCSLGGKEFDYSAKVQFQGMTYTGCGQKF